MVLPPENFSVFLIEKLKKLGVALFFLLGAIIDLCHRIDIPVVLLLHSSFACCKSC